MRRRPTRDELQAAVNRTMPDVIAANLRVLFCGINPGLYSAAVRRHFARPGNRFWPSLFAGGFTPRLFSPYEEKELLPLGYGITNVVNRATNAADELTVEEMIAGGKKLAAKVKRYKPRYLALLGVGVYRVAFGKPKATLGLQPDEMGKTKVWILPSPSGLNAHYKPVDLAKLFAELRQAAEAE